MSIVLKLIFVNFKGGGGEWFRWYEVFVLICLFYICLDLKEKENDGIKLKDWSIELCVLNLMLVLVFV